MASKKRMVSQIVSTIKGLKESKREIQAQHATLGAQISTLQAQHATFRRSNYTLEGRISTLEAQLSAYVTGSPIVENPNLSAEARINLTVKGMDGSEVIFRMKRDTQQEKLKSACYNRLHLDPEDYITFVYHGRRFRFDQTPEQFKLKIIVHQL